EDVEPCEQSLHGGGRGGLACQGLGGTSTRVDYLYGVFGSFTALSAGARDNQMKPYEAKKL
ncbi:unnamed protein product, partial [Ectocarpus sp. 12 AP-2014]